MPNYAWCVRFRAASSDTRKQVSKQTASTYLRVARLPADIGESLDAANVPFRHIRWIAWADGAAERLRRYNAVLEMRAAAVAKKAAIDLPEPSMEVLHAAIAERLDAFTKLSAALGHGTDGVVMTENME